MNTSKPELPEYIVGAVARGWCAPENANKVMDSDLAYAIVREVVSAIALASNEEVKVLRDVLESLYQMTSRYAISDSDYGIVCAAAAVLGSHSTPTAPVLAAEAASVEEPKADRVLFLNQWYGSGYTGEWPEHFVHAFTGWQAARRAMSAAAHVSALANSKTEAEDDTERMARLGRHVREFGIKGGWKPDDGEGVFEYIQRYSYTVGLEDAGAKLSPDRSQTNGSRWPITAFAPAAPQATQPEAGKENEE
jgi:hypothetical protein